VNIRPTIATRYFGPWKVERLGRGRLYEWLGIRLWKRWLRSSGNPSSRQPGAMNLASRRAGLRERLRQHDRFTRQYEVRHLLGGIAMQVGGWVFISMLSGGSLTLLTMANLLVNGYPILLQRYKRVRVHAALGRIGERDDLATGQHGAAPDDRRAR
jgi:hypothetical protein